MFYEENAAKIPAIQNSWVRRNGDRPDAGVALFPDPAQQSRSRQEALEKAMDEIRGRYGEDSILLGAQRAALSRDKT